MAVIDRHRVASLVELSAAERTLWGPERQLRGEDAKQLARAAYDDATDAARAEFMSRVQTMPTSAWPWSAVQVTTPRSGAGVRLGTAGVAPKPATTPALLVLIRGQADSVDIDPGNRLPDRGAPEAAEWEPLYKALDAWDTQAIMKAIGPQGWVSMLGATSGQVPKDTGNDAGGGGVEEEAPSDASTADLPAPQSPEMPAWQHPAVIVAGAAIVVAAGVAAYSLGQSRSRRELEDMLAQQEELS